MDFGNVTGFVMMLGVEQVHRPDCLGVIDARDIAMQSISIDYELTIRTRLVLFLVRRFSPKI